MIGIQEAEKPSVKFVLRALIPFALLKIYLTCLLYSKIGLTGSHSTDEAGERVFCLFLRFYVLEKDKDRFDKQVDPEYVIVKFKAHILPQAKLINKRQKPINNFFSNRVFTNGLKGIRITSKISIINIITDKIANLYI